MHGKIWTDSDINTLKSNVNCVSSLEDLCILLGRTRRSVWLKSKAIRISLEHLRFKGKFEDEEREKERRKKISESSKKSKLSGGYRKGSGRGKKGTYKGYYCDSSYELAWVIYHLEHNIPFERNEVKFEYYLNDLEKKYFIPDFKIHDIYYEIKGYNHESTYFKIKYFPFKIKILYGEDLKYMFDYVINKYGKNFIYLYEEKKYSCKLCQGPISKDNSNKLCLACFNRSQPRKKRKLTTKKEKKDKCICGNIKKITSQICVVCRRHKNKKVMKRPNLETLLNDVQELGYLGTGRKYNVSDTCIRKWIKIYNKIKNL